MGYRKLNIYKESFELANKVHHLTLKLPLTERFELASQTRRAAQSVRANIAEGYGRKRYKREYIRFLTFSIASCDELSSHLNMISSLYSFENLDDIIKQTDKTGKMINKYIQYIELNL